MSPVTHSELTPPGLARGLLFQPRILYRDAAPCSRAQKELQSFDFVPAKPENPSAFRSNPISLHGRGEMLFSANEGEKGAVNSKCSLKMGCTGEPKAPLLFHIHLMYPCWGAVSSCAQVSLNSCPQLCALGSLGMREQHEV